VGLISDGGASSSGLHEQRVHRSLTFNGVAEAELAGFGWSKGDRRVLGQLGAQV
jgi:hypothetical protein